MQIESSSTSSQAIECTESESQSCTISSVSETQCPIDGMTASNEIGIQCELLVDHIPIIKPMTSCIATIEIIDIECVLLSFLSKKIVSTKWRIEKGILVGPRLLRRGISRGCRECELFFQLKSLQKIYIGT